MQCNAAARAKRGRVHDVGRQSLGYPNTTTQSWKISDMNCFPVCD